MSERIALVTGATGGIGFHIATGLAAQGMRVIVTGRQRVDLDGLELLQVDHTSVAANRDLASEIRRLDVLVNNVGGTLTLERRETPDGIEATLATNFVCPLVLTEALLPVLRSGERPRVVNVISSVLKMWKRDPF